MVMRSWQKAIGSLFLAGILAVPVFSAPAGNMGPAQPGTVNYVEGQASIDSEPLNQNSVGTAGLQAGQTLATQNGKAEILLTPGVFLRVNGNTAVRIDRLRSKIPRSRFRADARWSRLGKFFQPITS